MKKILSKLLMSQHLKLLEPEMKTQILEIPLENKSTGRVNALKQLIGASLIKLNVWIKNNWERSERIHNQIQAQKEEIILKQIKSNSLPRLF